MNFFLFSASKKKLADDLSLVPALFKGVKHPNEPLTPIETFVTAKPTVTPPGGGGLSQYKHDLSPLQEGGSYSEQSESDIEITNKAASAITSAYYNNQRQQKSHVMDRQYDFTYIKETTGNNYNESLITKATAPCLTPIQEMTEMSNSPYSTATSPGELSDRDTNSRTTGEPQLRSNQTLARKPLGELEANTNNKLAATYDTARNVKTSGEKSDVKTSEKREIGDSRSEENGEIFSDHLLSPLLTFDRVSVPNPPHNTPDPYTAQDATLFFVEPFWDMGTSSSSPKVDRYER